MEQHLQYVTVYKGIEYTKNIISVCILQAKMLITTHQYGKEDWQNPSQTTCAETTVFVVEEMNNIKKETILEQILLHFFPFKL